MKRALQILIFCIIPLAAIAISCSGAPHVTVTNRSSKVLKNIEISGSGFTVTMPKVEPDSSEGVLVKPIGESSLRLKFTAGQKSYESSDMGYIEAMGGYCHEIVVSHDLQIETGHIGLFCFEPRRVFDLIKR